MSFTLFYDMIVVVIAAIIIAITSIIAVIVIIIIFIIVLLLFQSLYFHYHITFFYIMLWNCHCLLKYLFQLIFYLYSHYHYYHITSWLSLILFCPTLQSRHGTAGITSRTYTKSLSLHPPSPLPLSPLPPLSLCANNW